MRCYICDSYIEVPIIDDKDKKVKPCRVCLKVSEENLAMLMKKGPKRDIFSNDIDTGEQPIFDSDLLDWDEDYVDWHEDMDELDDFGDE